MELLEGLGSSHAVAFLHLVDVPLAKDHSKVHKNHALLAEVFYLHML